MVCPGSSDNQMWCWNVPLASRQRWRKLLLVLTPPSVLFIMAKVSPLTSPFLVSSWRILVEESIMLVLTVRLVGSSLRIFILVCNMVRLVAARYPQLSSYVNGCKSIALSWKTNMSLWIKGESFILILISSTSLPITIMKYILLELIHLIKMDQ